MLLTESPTLVFRGAAPYAELLVREQRELETRLAHRATGAHGLGRLDLGQRGPYRADREEEVGGRCPAGRVLAPPHVHRLNRLHPYCQCLPLAVPGCSPDAPRCPGSARCETP